MNTTTHVSSINLLNNLIADYLGAPLLQKKQNKLAISS